MDSPFINTVFIFLLCSSLASASDDCGDIDLIYNLFDLSNDAIFHNGEGTPGPRRLVTNQTSNIISLSSKRFVQAYPMDIDSLEVRIKKLDGSRIGGKTRFVICTIDDGKQVDQLEQFSIKGGRRNRGQSWTYTLRGLKDKKLAIRLKGQSPTGSARFDIDLIRPDGEGKRWRPLHSIHTQPLEGFADVHVHQAASLAFSGGWYWGSHEPGSLAHRLPACNGKNHGNVSNFLSGDTLDLSNHEGHYYGFPDYSHWPHWNEIKHQQVAERWLKQAHRNGLSLMVASLVNNQWLSAAMITSGHHNNRLSPFDMDSVKHQIYSLKKMAEQSSWYRIVRDPWEARRVIESGKLAVVLAVEVSNVFPDSDGDWRQQLHDLYAMGVRNVMLAHQTNSRFSGAAFHVDGFKALSKIKSTFDSEIDYASTGNGKHNTVGLTSEGIELLREMIRLNMLIDIAHMPLKSQRQIYQLVANKYNYYPLFNSHTRIKNLLHTDELNHFKEHLSSDEVLGFIRSTGGMIGLRTGVEGVKTYSSANGVRAITNNCDGSSRSYAQSVQYAAAFGVDAAFGSDFNGFITQMPPRYGNEGCSGQTDLSIRKQQQILQGELAYLSSTHRVFSYKGLAHIGLLPGLLEDLEQLGADTRSVGQSSEIFVRMWQRQYDNNRKKIE